jgi:hypothetical protein
LLALDFDPAQSGLAVFRLWEQYALEEGNTLQGRALAYPFWNQMDTNMPKGKDLDAAEGARAAVRAIPPKQSLDGAPISVLG